MNAADWASAGAAALGVSAIIALTVFYIHYGLHRPTGPRVRLAAFFLLATTGIGYTLEWWIESIGTESTARGYFAGLRLALAATLLNFALALYVEGRRGDEPHPERTRPPMPMN